MKQSKKAWIARLNNQPPSGGCVLKPLADGGKDEAENPAAFGRLCVETVVELPNALP